MKAEVHIVDGITHLIPVKWIEGYTSGPFGYSREQAIAEWHARETEARTEQRQLRGWLESNGLLGAPGEQDHQQNREPSK